MQKKAVITGGGTGGHIYPALAIAKRLEKEDWKILYIGSQQGLEIDIIPKEGFDFKHISVAPLPRKINLSLLKSIIKSTAGFYQSLNIILKFKPDVVIGTGGFVAGPVVLAADLLQKNTFIHEQNVFPGITNRLLSFTVNKIALNFAETKNYLSQRVKKKCVTTGNPVRDAIFNVKREEGAGRLNIDPDKKTLLVFGGSQGAISINKAMKEICQFFVDRDWLQIIYITGQKNYQQVIDSLGKTAEVSHIKILPYLDNIEWAYACADLVVYRAGATGLAEITALGIPAILIPYPHASENHQQYNANVLKEKGAAEVIADSELTFDILLEKVLEIITDNKKLKEMQQKSKQAGRVDSLDLLIREIKKLIK